MEIKKDAIIRLVLLTLALTNQFLVTLGKSPLPIEDETVTILLSAGFTVVTSLWAYWKNNSFTKEAIRADRVMEILKESDDENIQIQIRSNDGTQA